MKTSFPKPFVLCESGSPTDIKPCEILNKGDKVWANLPNTNLNGLVPFIVEDVWLGASVLYKPQASLICGGDYLKAATAHHKNGNWEIVGVVYGNPVPPPHKVFDDKFSYVLYNKNTLATNIKEGDEVSFWLSVHEKPLKKDHSKKYLQWNNPNLYGCCNCTVVSCCGKNAIIGMGGNWNKTAFAKQYNVVLKDEKWCIEKT